MKKPQLKKNAEKLYSLLTNSEARKKRSDRKRLDKLNEIRHLSDNELLLKQSSLKADKDSKKLLLTLIMASIIVAILLFLGKLSVRTVIAYINLNNKGNVSSSSMHEALVAVYVIIGTSLLISISLILVLYLFLRGQKNREELLALYENEEQRRKEKDGSN